MCHMASPIATVFKKCGQASRFLQFARKRLFSLYSLALTRMSFRDFPSRYDKRGGSLKIFLSCDWFCIKCHFPMSIFFKLGNVGWYCVTKGRIFFRAIGLSILIVASSNLTYSKKVSSATEG